MQSDETGDLGPGLELTRTRTSTHVLEVRQDDQQSKEDVLDMIREMCELVAEDDFDTADIRILKEKDLAAQTEWDPQDEDDWSMGRPEGNEWNWQAVQDIVPEDITHMRYELPVDLRTIEYADFIEGVDGKVLVDIGNGPAVKGSWRWTIDEYIRQNDLETYAVESEAEQSPYQIAVESLIDKGIDHLLEENELPTEKLSEGAEFATGPDNAPDVTDTVVRGDLFDLRDDKQHWVAPTQSGTDDTPGDPPVCVGCESELPPGTIAAVEADYDGAIKSTNNYLCGWCFDPAAAPDDAERGVPFVYPVGPEDAHYTPAGEDPLSHEELAQQRADEWIDSKSEEEINEIQDRFQDMSGQSDDEDDS